MTCEEPLYPADDGMTTVPWTEVDAGPTGPATPEDALAAFPHYTDEVSDPGQVATEQLDELEAMDPADKEAALGTMTPDEVAQLAADLPVEERARLVELAKHSPNPDDKLALFMAGQRAKVQQDASAELDGELDADTQAKVRERREKIAASTLEELEREQKYLEEKGAALTPDEVNAMIARKTREHDLEMKHNVNLTADETIREDGRFKGERVQWTEDELAVMELALAKSPHTQDGTNTDLEGFHRTQSIPGANADHHPDTRMIRIGDSVRSDGQHPDHAIYDPTGKPMPDHKYPTHEGESTDQTFMEWVVLHEIGHNVHGHPDRDFGSPETFEKYKRGMLINELDDEQIASRLDPEDISALDNGLQQVEKNGYVYVKEGNGYKAFPRAVFDDPDANPDAQEYFAQHYNQAILAPERTAVEYLDEPQAEEAKAKKDLADAQAKRDALAKSGGDTSAVDAELERLETARQHATAKRKTWEKTYDTMRNDVFGTDAAEEDARIRLEEAGVDTAEFDERAARLSTPDQIAELEQELLSRQGTP